MKLENLTPFAFGAKARRPALTKAISFGRIEAVAILFLVTGLSGCTKFGPSSGSLHFEGADAMGRFSGDVSAWDCEGHLGPGGLGFVLFSGTRRGHSISTGIDKFPFVSVLTPGAGFWLRPSECRTFDVRKWLDDDKHLHVVVRVDCTTQEGVVVKGSVGSDRCYINRPGTPRP